MVVTIKDPPLEGAQYALGDSPSATVLIADNDYKNPYDCPCPCTCPTGEVSYSVTEALGAVLVQAALGPLAGVGLAFGSILNPHPIIMIDFTLDPDEAPALAARVGVTADPAAMADDERVHAELAEQVEAVNQRFARIEQVKRFRILGRDLTQEDGELTPTMKVKRAVVAEMSSTSSASTPSMERSPGSRLVARTGVPNVMKTFSDSGRVGSRLFPTTCNGVRPVELPDTDISHGSEANPVSWKRALYTRMT